MIYLYQLLALTISCIGALTDIKSGCVKNKHLLCGFAIWLILIVVESIYNRSLAIPVKLFVPNLILSGIVSIVFYLTDIWAPGDCKLIIFIAMVYPLRAYTVRPGNVFPTLDMVIYAFATGYVFLMITSLARRVKGIKAESVENSQNPFGFQRIISIIANLGLISMASTVMDRYIPDFYYSNQMLCTLSVIGIICLLQSKADFIRRIFGFIGILYFIVITAISGSWLFGLINLLESILIVLIIELLNNKARMNTYREIPGGDVQPGMILSYSSIWNMQKCIDPELPRVTTENRRSRMTREQAEAVKRWCKNAKRNVVIVEMIPFAPFISLAVFIQIVRYFLIMH